MLAFVAVMDKKKNIIYFKTTFFKKGTETWGKEDIYKLEMCEIINFSLSICVCFILAKK